MFWSQIVFVNDHTLWLLVHQFSLWQLCLCFSGSVEVSRRSPVASWLCAMLYCFGSYILADIMLGSSPLDYFQHNSHILLASAVWWESPPMVLAFTQEEIQVPGYTKVIGGFGWDGVQIQTVYVEDGQTVVVWQEQLLWGFSLIQICEAKLVPPWGCNTIYEWMKRVNSRFKILQHRSTMKLHEQQSMLDA